LAKGRSAQNVLFEYFYVWFKSLYNFVASLYTSARNIDTRQTNIYYDGTDY